MDKDFGIPTGLLLFIIYLLMKSVGESYGQKVIKAK